MVCVCARTIQRLSEPGRVTKKVCVCVCVWRFRLYSVADASARPSDLLLACVFVCARFGLPFTAWRIPTVSYCWQRRCALTAGPWQRLPSVHSSPVRQFLACTFAMSIVFPRACGLPLCVHFPCPFFQCVQFSSVLVVFYRTTLCLLHSNAPVLCLLHLLYLRFDHTVPV